MTDTIDTEALWALADAATDAMSGTWTVSGLDDAGRYGVMTDDPDLAGQYVAHGALEEVAEFIAAARTALPALLDALAERDAEVARLRDGWATATTAHAEEVARLRRQMASDNSALVIEAENVGRGIALVKTERARADAAEAKVDRLGRELAAANAECQRLCTQQSAAAAEVAALREAARVLYRPTVDGAR